MARISADRLVASIDVGTTKICVLIAHQLDGDNLEVIGVGKAPSDGLKKGVVVDVAKTIYSIRTAVQEAELMAGVQVENASVGISGGHIESRNSHGVVAIKRGDIRASDLDNVLAAAKAIPIAEGQQILHVMPQYFVIDGQDKVHDPIGMHGIRLEVQAHIILGAIASVQNLVKCCQMAGVNVSDIILEQLASADAVLSPDEKELGVAVLDIGGGTSDLALYQHGSIVHTMVLPIAGNHFTNDIAVCLRTTRAEAERIKKKHGCAHSDALQDADIKIEKVQGSEHTVVQARQLVCILKPRATELLSFVHEEIITRHLQNFMPTGVVITGGGSLLGGMEQLAGTIFNMPVRIGHPRVAFDLPESLHSPIYATGYGLLLYTVRKRASAHMYQMEGPLVKRVFERMKSWVLDLF